MTILALELSSVRGSIAWQDGDGGPEAVSFANDRKHSGAFFAQLQRTLASCGRIDRIVVGLGPGSYAGTRIAIAAAIGLQTATGAELIGLSSLLALETEAPEYWVIGDARRQTFFSAQVRDQRCVWGPELCTADELHEQLSTIMAPVFTIEPLPAFARAVVVYPSAARLAHLGRAEQVDATGAPLEPIYLRAAHITMPKSGGAGLRPAQI